MKKTLTAFIALTLGITLHAQTNIIKNGVNTIVSGINNSFFGFEAGLNSTGSNNAFFGIQSGVNNQGSGNLFAGYRSGFRKTTGNNNVFLGRDAGYNTTSGKRNVFIGYQAGYNEMSDHKLYIDNSNTSSPLIYGDFSSNHLVVNGTLGVGIAPLDIPLNYKFAVSGKIISEEVKVELESAWPDFVFEDAYNLPTLQQVESHIKEKRHLPSIPSAKEVEKNGIFLGEMNAKLLQKIEELTLYTILQEKEIKTLQKKFNQLEMLIKSTRK